MIEVPIIHIISIKKGVGKTTLLKKVINKLKSRGLKVIAVKHTIHEQLDIRDRDTYKLKKAGADYVIGISRKGSAVFLEESKLEKILERLGIDRGLVLVEGFKSGPGYKLLLVEDEKVELKKIDNLIALLVKRRELAEKLKDWGVKILYYHDIEQVTSLILETALNHVINILPGLNCKMCGRDTCRDFALDFLQGKVTISDCRHLRKKAVKLIVDGNEIPLGPYPSKVFKKVALALVDTLKGVPKEPKSIELKVELST